MDDWTVWFSAGRFNARQKKNAQENLTILIQKLLGTMAMAHVIPRLPDFRHSYIFRLPYSARRLAAVERGELCRSGL